MKLPHCESDHINSNVNLEDLCVCLVQMHPSYTLKILVDETIIYSSLPITTYGGWECVSTFQTGKESHLFGGHIIEVYSHFVFRITLLE